MSMKGVVLYGTALTLLTTAGCMPLRLEPSGVEPRPLGQEIHASLPFARPVEGQTPPAIVEEPTGTVTLRQLLGVALQRHPEQKLIQPQIQILIRLKSRAIVWRRFRPRPHCRCR